MSQPVDTTSVPKRIADLLLATTTAEALAAAELGAEARAGAVCKEKSRMDEAQGQYSILVTDSGEGSAQR